MFLLITNQSGWKSVWPVRLSPDEIEVPGNVPPRAFQFQFNVIIMYNCVKYADKMFNLSSGWQEKETWTKGKIVFYSLSIPFEHYFFIYSVFLLITNQSGSKSVWPVWLSPDEIEVPGNVPPRAFKFQFNVIIMYNWVKDADKMFKLTSGRQERETWMKGVIFFYSLSIPFEHYFFIYSVCSFWSLIKMAQRACDLYDWVLTIIEVPGNVPPWLLQISVQS